MKKTYIHPEQEVIQLKTLRPMLLSMSNTETNTQFAPEFQLDDEE